jgi:atypical dual specificity phosphatase
MEPGDVPRRIHGILTGRPMNVSFVDDLVCGSARPMSRRAVLWLKEEAGINSILSVTEEPLPQAVLADGMEYKHVSVRNHFAPTLPQIEESVNFLLSETLENRKVVVHCAAGKGRTGTILASYLCARYSLSAEEAIKKVRATRPGSVEKKRQERAVMEFAKYYRAKTSPT